MMTKEDLKVLIETACELVFTYPDWTSEHVDEYMNCFDGPVPYDGDMLYTACQYIDQDKKQSYHDTVTHFVESGTLEFLRTY